MGFKVNREAMENAGSGDYAKETMFIKAGVQQARLVSYVELGKHAPIFNGKPAIYGKESKKSGQPKPPELMLHLVFEFPRAEFTGDFPLTIKTSIPWNNEFLNKLSITEAMESGNISMTYANRSKFMKYLNAMNDACGTNYDGLDDFVGEAFLVSVTNKPGKKADADGNLPMYANMSPDGINSTKYIDQMDQQEKEAKVPETLGEYCPVFSWDTPTEEAWGALPKYLQTCIKSAVNFPGSPVDAMLAGMPEETEPDTAPEDNKGKPATQEDDIPV